jgi:hypothetical protein
VHGQGTGEARDEMTCLNLLRCRSGEGHRFSVERASGASARLVDLASRGHDLFGHHGAGAI